MASNLTGCCEYARLDLAACMTAALLFKLACGSHLEWLHSQASLSEGQHEAHRQTGLANTRVSASYDNYSNHTAVKATGGKRPLGFIEQQAGDDVPGLQA